MSDLLDDLKGIVRGVLDAVLGAVRYGNWTGYNWSAGQRGLENLEKEDLAVKTRDLFDAASKEHDKAYFKAKHSYKAALASGVPEHEAKRAYHAAIADADEAYVEEAGEVNADNLLGEIIRLGAILIFKAKAYFHRLLSGDHSNEDSGSPEQPVDPKNIGPEYGPDIGTTFGGSTPGSDPKGSQSSRSESRDKDNDGGEPSADTSHGESLRSSRADRASESSRSEFTNMDQDGDGFYDGGGDGDSGWGGKPVVLDLDGDGVELVSLEDSTAFYDIDGDGYRERMGWVSPDDGLLAYDRNGDGEISGREELSFVDYVAGARTDLEGLRHFDSNGDGRLDASDAEWGRFRVWRDLDQDGESDPGELRTLAEAGVRSIGLTSDGEVRTVAGNRVFGEGRYTDGEGVGSLYDVGLRYSAYGLREESDGGLTVSLGGLGALVSGGRGDEGEAGRDRARGRGGVRL